MTINTQELLNLIDFVFPFNSLGITRAISIAIIYLFVGGICVRWLMNERIAAKEANIITLRDKIKDTINIDKSLDEIKSLIIPSPVKQKIPNRIAEARLSLTGNRDLAGVLRLNIKINYGAKLLRIYIEHAMMSGEEWMDSVRCVVFSQDNVARGEKYSIPIVTQIHHTKPNQAPISYRWGDGSFGESNNYLWPDQSPKARAVFVFDNDNENEEYFYFHIIKLTETEIEFADQNNERVASPLSWKHS